MSSTASPVAALQVAESAVQAQNATSAASAASGQERSTSGQGASAAATPSRANSPIAAAACDWGSRPPVSNARIAGAARSAAAHTHNARVPTRSLVRAGLVLLSLAGVVAGAVTLRSERTYVDAFEAAIEQRPVDEVDDLFEKSRPLNPDAAREVTMGRANFEAGRRARADELMTRAAELEPDSARVWFFRTRLALALGRRGDAARYWERARLLDPQLPRALPPPL